MPFTPFGIVAEDTLAGLIAAQPFGVDFRNQYARATGTDNVYRIDASGNLKGGLSIPFEALSQTGASVTVSGLPASPSKLQVVREGQTLHFSEYSTVAGQINFTDPLANESVWGWYEF